jgi:periplasmic divalent cation tolerance protein
MSSEYVVVLTTLPADTDGPAFAHALVEERLAACVNLLPAMDSVYRWQGTVEHEHERQVIIKTTAPRVDALWQRVRDLHPYDVPEFIVIPVIDGNQVYLQWVADSTASVSDA